MKIDIEKYISKLSNLFAQEPVKVVYLFGSQAMGTAGPLSDIDIGILLNSNVAKVNYFNYRLTFTSKLISIFQFEVKALDEYLDFLPMQERYFEQLLKNIEEGRFLDRPRINRC
ncbi:nucleotidyltransferase domain-containing protein [bacterium]|nr:nucleotidyltransferase domain-containing protein [bacterium]